MAPEVLEGCITFNRAAYKQIDCYAVGLIFYEIMTRTELNGGECYKYASISLGTYTSMRARVDACSYVHKITLSVSIMGPRIIIIIYT